MSTNDVLTVEGREELRQAFESANSAAEKLKLLEKMSESGFEGKELGSEYEQMVVTAFGRGGEEAIEALTAVIISHGDLHPGLKATALVYKAVANLDMGKFDDAKKDFEIVQKILEELLLDENSISPEKAAARFVELVGLYQEMGDSEKAIYCLRRVLAIPELPLESLEINSGRLALLLVEYGKAEQGIFYSELENVMKKLDEFGPEYSGLLGYAYEHLGRAYINPNRMDLAAKCLEYAKGIMDATLGPQHLDSLDTSQILSLAYAKTGRFALGIETQEKVVEALRGLGPSVKERFEEAVGILVLLIVNKAGFESMLASSPEFGVSDLVCMLDDIVESGMLGNFEEFGDDEL